MKQKKSAKAAASDLERIAAYLSGLDPEKRSALEELRRQIKAAAPGAEECVSYQMPAFRQGGVLLCYGAWKAHCAIYPGGALTRKFADQLRAYDLDKGTIRFSPNKPLPAALVRKIVKARIADIEARKGGRRRRGA